MFLYSRSVIGFACASVVATLAHAANPVVINFDDLAALTTLTTQYSSQGAVFDGKLSTYNMTFSGDIVVPSPPNYAVMNTPTVTTISFQNNGVNAVTDSAQIATLGLTNSPGCLAGATLTALDLQGNAIGSPVTIPPVGPGQSQTSSMVGFTNTPGIHALQITYNSTTNCVSGLFGFDNLTFDAPVVPSSPTITKTFGPGKMIPGGTSTVTFTVTNPNTTSGTNATLTNLSFTDNLPTGLVVATPSNATGTCNGGSFTAANGGSQIKLTGGSLAPGTSCTLTANVTTAPGYMLVTSDMMITNQVSGVSSNEAPTGMGTSANVDVVCPYASASWWFWYVCPAY